MVQNLLLNFVLNMNIKINKDGSIQNNKAYKFTYQLRTKSVIYNVYSLIYLFETPYNVQNKIGYDTFPIFYHLTQYEPDL